MLEVHASSRPGRPAVLIILSGMLLAGCLGLAWFQTSDKRALGPPERIAGTPLIVRPPRGWIQVPDDPGRFVLAEKSDLQGTRGALDRQVYFHHERSLAYISAKHIIEARGGWNDYVQTQIRGIPAVQAWRRVSQRAFGHTFHKDSLLRVASHPRGDVIAVEYWTMMELSSGDYELLDAICAAIDFVDPELKRVGDDAKQHAGLAFPTLPGWSVVGPRHEHTEALHVLRPDRDGDDQGAVAVARTWLAPGRTLEMILRDHVSLERPDWRTRARVLEWGRRDGIVVQGIQIPDPKAPYSQTYLAYALSDERGNAALILPDPGGHAASGFALAARLADVVSFAPQRQNTPDYETFARAGETLAAKIQANGAVSWWGRNPSRREYLHQGRGPAALAHISERRSAGRSGDGYAYRGTQLTVDTAAKRFARSRWTLDANAAEYRLTIEMGREDPLLRGAHGMMGEWTIRESRASGSPNVRRELLRGAETISESSFTSGATFVAPPAEEIAEIMVAAAAPDAVLLEVSHPLGTGANQRLLRRLEPDAAGRARVLRVDDFAPLGVVLTFDAEPGPASCEIEGLVIPEFDPELNPGEPLPRILLRMRELLDSER